MSEHKFPYRWSLTDGYPAKGVEYHGAKVFGTFVCGGGSTMGYKMAGFNHLGGVEIDPKVAEVYRINHNPNHLFVEDIRLFNQREDLPAELYDLDLLDGSPPCSSFSMAGNREKDWGKKKQFREGQEVQRLDDLVFEYVRTIKKLQPKVALLENVKGLIAGNAKAYAKKLKTEFEAAGYRVQVFLLNAASMGVPQKRERVFFIGLRVDFEYPPIVLRFFESAIPFGAFANHMGKDLPKNGKLFSDWRNRQHGDKNFSQICLRQENAAKRFGRVLLNDIQVSPTLISGNQYIYFDKFQEIGDNDICQVGSFPIDFNFQELSPTYLIGMSVPPVMTAQIAHQIWLQWLAKISENSVKNGE